MKKQLLSSALVAGTLMAALPSHALVRLVKSCETADGQYQVTVTGNQGIGEVRLAVYGAQIYDNQGNLLTSYSVHQEKIGSASFGRHNFIDNQTEGKLFNLALPSTNAPQTDLTAVLADGTVLNEKNLSCNP